MSASSASITEKKGHVCPPSNAKHPSDRWETSFIYSFVCKFTQLRAKVEGLETPMDLENALLSRDADPIILQILQQFVLNLRPQTRNLSADQITSTVATLLSEFFKSTERSVFWNDDTKLNVDPFDGLQGSFFEQDWDFKLKVFRQLVELQLEHNVEIKSMIDLAWGVQHNKHKKKEVQDLPPDPSDPRSKEKLQLIPIGQDTQRKRYWVVDDSPRIYVSSNPWKMAASFQTISSTREEYIATIDSLKASAPTEPKANEKRSKIEQGHLALIKGLEDRIEAIDQEIARVAKVRRKIEQRALLQAQAEVRTTRTRRQTRKPDYVYTDFVNSEDEGDEYTYNEDEDYDEPMDEDEEFGDSGNGPRRTSGRRSTRNTAGSSNGTDTWSQWRGERRSSRLGAPPDTQLDDLPRKRARTEESTASASSADYGHERYSSGTPLGEMGSVTIPKKHGAASVKPTEVAMEQIVGKKKSKFWFYAVEPVPAPAGESATSSTSGGGGSSRSNGHANNNHIGASDEDEPPDNVSNGVDMDVDKNLEGSLSPAPMSP